MIQRRQLALAAALVLTGLAAQAQDTIKIGEVNSYKAQPAFLEPYKKGMELAVEEINATGGVNGKKIELITRDDNASPGDAVRAAEELVSREKIDVLAGAFLSNTGLALTDFAKQKKFFYLAGEPLTDKIIWASGNRYTWRLRPGTYMQAAMLVPEAARLKKKRWAVFERKAPASTSIFSRERSSSAARTASPGLALSSRVISSSFLPSMPPAALTSSTASSMPFLYGSRNAGCAL